MPLNLWDPCIILVDVMNNQTKTTLKFFFSQTGWQIQVIVLKRSIRFSQAMLIRQKPWSTGDGAFFPFMVIVET